MIIRNKVLIYFKINRKNRIKNFLKDSLNKIEEHHTKRIKYMVFSPINTFINTFA